ncbi:hypothetical protein [Mycolicibacterium smegmatis]|uniref:hypothetical protein n=1 Tax=Mycolicibacterium smegmatis TaxID=1772 RepID=UPI00130377F1|nr:hypothetical protein [Mycolicibacterium smegmatis]
MTAGRDLLLTPVSSGRHPSADSTDLTGTWVCVGLAEQLTEVGAILPATIGQHAAHVRLTEAGPVAALNARPFGGCLSVPVHCGSTRNVRCPHRACAFSEDGPVLDDLTDPRGVARSEFVGRRTVNIPLAQWGSLLFVNVTMRTPPPLPVPDVTWDGVALVGTGSDTVAGNWLQAPSRAAEQVTAACPWARTVTIAPNVVVIRDDRDVLAVFSRPAGKYRSTMTWAVFANSKGSGALGAAAARVWGSSRGPVA